MEPKRRTFLGWVSGGIAACIGLMLGVPLAGYTILPALRRRETKWSDAGPAASLHPGIPQEMNLVISVTDGWQKKSMKKSVWAVKKEKESLVVYSSLCTHLGCGYRWDAQQKQFHCPCHNSVFSLNGDVISGPAPRPLDTLPVKIEKGHLLVNYKEFKAGTARKIEL